MKDRERYEIVLEDAAKPGHRLPPVHRRLAILLKRALRDWSLVCRSARAVSTADTKRKDGEQ
jgi:hypothetical protein